MTAKFERIGKHLYQRRYQNASGDWTIKYYGRFRCRLKKKPRVISLGSSNLAEAKDKLREKLVQDSKLYDFDLDKQRTESKPRDGKSESFTFAEWSAKYPTFDDIRRKRSLSDDQRMIRLHLRP